MNSLLQYFGATYLINLPERKDRLKSATKELARVGWTFGPGTVQLYSAQKFIDCAGFPFSPSVRGCFHSHSECIRSAYQRGKESVLLIEDDIALSASIRHLSPYIISQLQAMRWDFVYLGHENTGDIPNATSRTTEVDLLRVDLEVRTTHFFAVHARIFERLLAHLDLVAAGIPGDQEFGPMPVDGAFNIFRRHNPDVRTVIANPKLGWQRSSRSDITPRSFDNIRTLRPLLDIMRNFKHSVSRWRS